MKPIFVDTSALIALGNKRDTLHNQAKQVRHELVSSHNMFVTTSLVVVELCSAFSNLNLRSTAIELVESLRQSDKWTYIDIDRKLMERGFQLFKQMTDKEWSLVDCVSIVAAREVGSTKVFTADNHFQQAGFQILLRI